MGHEIIANHGQADSNIEYQEFYKAYEAVLKTISPKKQLIFRLRFHEDLSTKVIADQLGITRKTVQNQLGRAIEQLRLKIRLLF
jgi:RNA polymerase sigma-70 factor (ECF subfamily)